MNKLKIDVNHEKKIIIIDILGVINESTIEKLNTNINRIKLTNDSLSDWRFNIYMCHMVLEKTGLESIQGLMNQYKDTFKMIDIIIAKPMKKYKMWLDDMIKTHFTNNHIKTLATNNIFKFNYYIN